MPIPIRQNLAVASYLMRQRFAKNDKFPLIVEARAALRLQPLLPGLREDPVPDRDPAETADS